jgi:hypothetical protein
MMWNIFAVNRFLHMFCTKGIAFHWFSEVALGICKSLGGITLHLRRLSYWLMSLKVFCYNYWVSTRNCCSLVNKWIQRNLADLHQMTLDKKKKMKIEDINTYLWECYVDRQIRDNKLLQTIESLDMVPLAMKFPHNFFALYIVTIADYSLKTNFHFAYVLSNNQQMRNISAVLEQLTWSLTKLFSRYGAAPRSTRRILWRTDRSVYIVQGGRKCDFFVSIYSQDWQLIHQSHPFCQGILGRPCKTFCTAVPKAAMKFPHNFFALYIVTIADYSLKTNFPFSSGPSMVEKDSKPWTSQWI